MTDVTIFTDFPWFYFEVFDSEQRWNRIDGCYGVGERWSNCDDKTL